MKTHEEAIRVKERIEAETMAKPGVTGIDVGYRKVKGKNKDELVIRIYVADLRKVPHLPAQVDGVPIEIIERRFELH